MVDPNGRVALGNVDPAAASVPGANLPRPASSNVLRRGGTNVRIRSKQQPPLIGGMTQQQQLQHQQDRRDAGYGPLPGITHPPAFNPNPTTFPGQLSGSSALGGTPFVPGIQELSRPNFLPVPQIGGQSTQSPTPQSQAMQPVGANPQWPGEMPAPSALRRPSNIPLDATGQPTAMGSPPGGWSVRPNYDPAATSRMGDAAVEAGRQDMLQGTLPIADALAQGGPEMASTVMRNRQAQAAARAQSARDAMLEDAKREFLGSSLLPGTQFDRPSMNMPGRPNRWVTRGGNVDQPDAQPGPGVMRPMSDNDRAHREKMMQDINKTAQRDQNPGDYRYRPKTAGVGPDGSAMGPDGNPLPVTEGESRYDIAKRKLGDYQDMMREKRKAKHDAMWQPYEVRAKNVHDAAAAEKTARGERLKYRREAQLPRPDSFGGFGMNPRAALVMRGQNLDYMASQNALTASQNTEAERRRQFDAAQQTQQEQFKATQEAQRPLTQAQADAMKTETELMKKGAAERETQRGQLMEELKQLPPESPRAMEINDELSRLAAEERDAKERQANTGQQPPQGTSSDIPTPETVTRPSQPTRQGSFSDIDVKEYEGRYNSEVKAKLGLPATVDDLTAESVATGIMSYYKPVTSGPVKADIKDTEIDKVAKWTGKTKPVEKGGGTDSQVKWGIDQEMRKISSSSSTAEEKATARKRIRALAKWSQTRGLSHTMRQVIDGYAWRSNGGDFKWVKVE
jgi:hypothetical protein